MEEEPIVDIPPQPDEPEPAPEEPELPPAAEAEEAGGSSRGWWRRRHEDDEAAPEEELPRHVRVLPAAAEPAADPWEEGFDGPAAFDEIEEPALVEDEAPRRFRRR